MVIIFLGLLYHITDFQLIYHVPTGMFCDYFVVGCKTAKGLTVLLIERGEGVDTTRIKTSYST